jgi:hypothetical protein
MLTLKFEQFHEIFMAHQRIGTRTPQKMNSYPRPRKKQVNLNERGILKVNGLFIKHDDVRKSCGFWGFCENDNASFPRLSNNLSSDWLFIHVGKDSSHYNRKLILQPPTLRHQSETILFPQEVVIIKKKD